jgi:hypothetical protein
MFVGQETLGWSFEGRADCQPPRPPLKTLTDFLNSSESIQAAIDWYEEFAFAKHNPGNYNSPFWRAFRLLLEQLNFDANTELLWTNLFRCDLDGGAVVKKSTSAELKEVLAFQRGLLAQEFAVLRPTHALFFTGPDYDPALLAEFPGAVLLPIDGRDERQLSRVVHTGLPPGAFRTYHPNYLARCAERWSWLHDIVRYVDAEGPSAV